MSHKLLIGHCSIKKELFLPFLAVGLVWANTAVAINVPGGTFDDYDAGGARNWRYVKDIAGCDWTAEFYSGNPWVGNNYANGYPTLGHTGVQWVDLNAGYIHQALTGETYEEGVTYELSAWITTTSSGQGLYLYFLEGDDWRNPLDTGYFDVAVEPDLSTWSKYSHQYTATAADDGKTMGISIYGRRITYADTITLIIEPMAAGLPVITSDPVEVVVDETRTAVFTVEHVNGTSYEWHKVGTGVVESGTTTSRETITLSISGVTQADEGHYYCKVINDKVPGGVDSAQAQLTVTALTCGDWGHLRSDINRDCYVNLLDLVELAAKWLNGTLH
jgi:hypothetical protein